MKNANNPYTFKYHVTVILSRYKTVKLPLIRCFFMLKNRSNIYVSCLIVHTTDLFSHFKISSLIFFFISRIKM